MTSIVLWLMRVRCGWLFHHFEKCDYDSGMYLGHAWYCSRCLGPYEYDEEFVLGSPWSRLLWRLTPRIYHWWHSWSWRFTDR